MKVVRVTVSRPRTSEKRHSVPPAGAKRVRAKKTPFVDDLAGIWDDGQIMSKEEQYRRIVRKIRDKRKAAIQWTFPFSRRIIKASKWHDYNAGNDYCPELYTVALI